MLRRRNDYHIPMNMSFRPILFGRTTVCTVELEEQATRTNLDFFGTGEHLIECGKHLTDHILGALPEVFTSNILTELLLSS